MRAKISKLIVLIIVLSAFISGAYANGLFPDSAEVFTEGVNFVQLPSLTDTLKLAPDAENWTKDGICELVYNNVTEEDFNVFSEYLNNYGCTLVEHTMVNNLFNAKVEYQGSIFDFEYDVIRRTARLVYPYGAYVETYPFRYVSKGDIIKFGRYEQDNDLSNGSEPIEWIVLEAGDNSCKVISKYGLDAQSYNTAGGTATWATCSLRKWLNEEFYNIAFSSSEKSMITTSTVKPDVAPDFPFTDPGSETVDSLYIMSMSEAQKYFPSESERVAEVTAYTIDQRILKGSEKNTHLGGWRLRTPGPSTKSTCTVNDDGKIATGGTFIDSHYYSIRPVMTISIS